jgi:hypothetical protein
MSQKPKGPIFFVLRFCFCFCFGNSGRAYTHKAQSSKAKTPKSKKATRV